MAEPSRPPELDGEPFAILAVCTANMCRSPIAEHLIRRSLRAWFGRAAGWDWVVRSAGTHVEPGSSMHPLAREVLNERGIPTEGAAARQATAAMLERADLVLTASRAQRAWVVERQPSAVRRVFTLRQFARLCAAGRSLAEGHAIERGADLLDLASLGRGRVQPVSEQDDMITDPVGQGVEAFRICGDVIDECIDSILGPVRH